MSGWIKMHRSILNHWLYTEKRKFSKFEAWQDMLLNVNYSDNKTIIKGNLYEVKRGQSILSLDSWSKRWNWDKSSVRRFFNLLEKDEMIVVKSDNVTTHLTICKYEDYQQGENANETQTKHRRTADEIQTTPIEESKESKEEKNNIDSRKTSFANSLKPFVGVYSKEMLNEFYFYWTEHGVNDKKMRFEKQTSFDINLRLLNWNKRSESFKQKEFKKEVLFVTPEGIEITDKLVLHVYQQTGKV